VSIDDSGDTARRCWMCGAPAVSGCDAKLVLKAASSRQLDGLGYPVQRGRRLDKVRIEMPRCGSCRSWVSGWIAVLAVVVVMAGIAGTLVQSFVFPAAVAPAWLKVHHHGIGNVGTGIGLILGFIVALLGMAWERKRSGRQSANTYPPVVSLRRLGWSFLSD
jgi:amino acid transporter